MAEREFDGRVALVTGGSRGIGRAACVRLAQGGAKVAIGFGGNAEAAAETQKLVESTGGAAITIAADVTDPGAVADMVETCERALGPVDLLFANAGLASSEDHTDLDFAAWRRLMDVNVDGVFHTVMAVKDGMISRGFGRIAVTASIAGLAPRPRLIAYGTSKAAVIAFVRNCAGGFAPSVRINAIAPGLTETDMIASLTPEARANMVETTPLQRVAQPEEIAELAAFLLSERSSFITGQTYVADGGRVTLP